MRSSNAPGFHGPARALLAALFGLWIAGCAMPSTDSTVAEVAPASRNATLLVSLNDGSIISQTVDIDADICMKSNSSPVTQCLRRGEPVYDPDGGTVIGYRMERSEIELVGR
jgi:hypothetical protein